MHDNDLICGYIADIHFSHSSALILAHIIKKNFNSAYYICFIVTAEEGGHTLHAAKIILVKLQSPSYY